MPVLGIIQCVGYFHVFSALLGVFELTFMGDCYDTIAKFLVCLYQCVLATLDRIIGEYGSI